MIFLSKRMKRFSVKLNQSFGGALLSPSRWPEVIFQTLNGFKAREQSVPYMMLHPNKLTVSTYRGDLSRNVGAGFWCMNILQNGQEHRLNWIKFYWKMCK